MNKNENGQSTGVEMGCVTLYPPLYSLQASQRCYMCGEAASVFCLAASGFTQEDLRADEFVLLSNVVAMPSVLDIQLKGRVGRYYLDYSKQRSNCYYLNHCHCGTKLSEYSIHNEAGGAFNPLSVEEAAAISMTELGVVEPITLQASPIVQDTPLIFDYAQRVAV